MNEFYRAKFNELFAEFTRYLVEHDVDVYALSPQKLSLEDLFIQLVGTEGG